MEAPGYDPGQDTVIKSAPAPIVSDSDRSLMVGRRPQPEFKTPSLAVAIPDTHE